MPNAPRNFSIFPLRRSAVDRSLCFRKGQIALAGSRNRRSAGAVSVLTKCDALTKKITNILPILSLVATFKTPAAVAPAALTAATFFHLASLRHAQPRPASLLDQRDTPISERRLGVDCYRYTLSTKTGKLARVARAHDSRPPFSPLGGITTVNVDIASLLEAPDSSESSAARSQYSGSIPVYPPTANTATTAPPPGFPPHVPLPVTARSAGSGRRAMPPHVADVPAKKQSKWSPEEDALIIELRGGGMKWEDISKRLPGRSAISCRLHYQNYLERRSEWDEERKNKLARLYER